MKAAWHGKGDIRCDTVPDPKIQDGRDAIIKVTSCAICGSDIHLLDGVIPAMEKGDVLGHETTGEVVEVGSENKALKVGDRVVIPFTISESASSASAASSPAASVPTRMRRRPRSCGVTRPPGCSATRICSVNSPAVRRNIYGFRTPTSVPSRSHDQVMFLSDIFSTGYMAADLCNLKGGETVAIWGCGPVGQFAIKSAFLLGAERVIAIDTVPERLALAQASGAITLDFMKEDIYDRIQELTSGRGADACIDAVGTEPETRSGFDAVVDRIKVATFVGTDRPHALRQAIHCCRNFGTVSIVGVYGGLLDKIPMGSAINRGLTFRMAQTPVQYYLPRLLERVEKGEIDSSFVITHRALLEQGPELYKRRTVHQGRLEAVISWRGS